MAERADLRDRDHEDVVQSVRRAIENSKLVGNAWGEPIDHLRHDLIVEAKGATYTALNVEAEAEDRWIAQCVVDV